MSTVTTWYLQMHSRDALRAARRNPDLEVHECEIAQFEVNRFLYQLVGAAWDWTDKNCWSDAQWREWAEQPDLRTWIAYHRGSIAGYYELHRQPGEQIEIAYFGLAPRFIGRGFGGDMLTRSIASAWDWGARRVWGHTCSLDHESALANYQARGLALYDTQTE
jgi:GNAT superfamily N-acetyltransferase